MKKNLLYTAIVLLLATLAGCSKSQTVVESREMVLRPVMATSPMGDMSEESDTKADPDLSGTTLGTDNSYVIYTSASNVDHPHFMEDQLYSYVGDTWHASSAVGVEDPEYWPLGGRNPLDFLAYACPPEAHDDLGPDGEDLIAWNASIPANGFTISDWDTYEYQYDVMFAVANGQTQFTSSGNVNLLFRHSMAVIGFTAEATFADIYTLHSITLKSLIHTGTFTVDNSLTEFRAGWSSLGAPADKAIHKLDDAADDDLDFAVPTSAAQCAMHLLVPPQESRTLVITYKITGCDVLWEKEVAIPRIQWRMGYKYIYAINFNADEIKVSVTEEDWVDVDEDVTASPTP